jgi:type II secretory pathway pseudopilin PulG
MIELVVVILIILVAIGFFLPPLRNVREAAARTASSNNLKQMALALHNAAENNEGRMPPSLGNYGYPGVPLSGTLFFHILPYLEQDNVYNNKAFEAFIKSFAAAADTTQDPTLPLTSYASNFLVFRTKGAKLETAEDKNTTFKNGTSNTVILMERFARNGEPPIHHYWAGGSKSPGDAASSTNLDTALTATDGSRGEGPGNGFGFQAKPSYDNIDNTVPQGMSTGGLQVAMGDGSVRTVPTGVSALTWFRACDPTNTAPLPNDW